MPNELGDAIRAQRLSVGMSQRQMGQAAGGRSVNQMNAYECGRSRPSPPVLAAIAKAIKTTPEALLGTPKAPIANSSVTKLVSELRETVASVLCVNSNAVRISVELL